ncbi:DUF1697 domain-containing protein [Wenyingzhuangia sp. IMCC45574]
MVYIVLLRGVNVSGKNKLIMKDFVNLLLQETEFDFVKSYIQSGNFVIQSSIQNSELMSSKIKVIIAKVYQYDIDVFSFSITDFTKIVKAHPYEILEKRNYIAFTDEKASSEKIDNLKNKDFGGDLFTIDDNAIHLQYETQYSKSKLTNNYLEKQLGIRATMRNWNTVQKLIGLAKDI